MAYTRFSSACNYVYDDIYSGLLCYACHFTKPTVEELAGDVIFGKDVDAAIAHLARHLRCCKDYGSYEGIIRLLDRHKVEWRIGDEKRSQGLGGKV